MIAFLMFTIGKLSSLADVSADALRYYEREGLLTPTSKSEGGYRLYDDASVRRVRLIKQAQQCGFTLAEICELLALRSDNDACCGDIRTRAIEKKLQLEGKIHTLRGMSKALDALIADCAHEDHSVKECPILAALERAAAVARSE